MSTATAEQTLNAGAQPADQKPKTSEGFAANIGATFKSTTGKVCAVTGGVGMQIVLTLVQVYLAMLFIEFLGLGFFLGSAIGIVGFFLLGYIGNGLAGGSWNPFEYFSQLVG